jgi:tetratricopeptide (TPR) repeat protein
MADAETARRLYEDGIDAYRAGEYEEALEVMARAQQLFAEAGDRSAESEVLNDMGVVHVQLEEWDKAEELLDEALSIRVTLEARSAQGITLGNLGMMYAGQGEEEKAAEAYEQAIAIFHELGEKGNEKAVARQLSKLKIKKGKFLDALGDYQTELEGEEELSGAQKMARRLFGVLGRFAGGAAIEDEEEEEGDVIDVIPESDE